MTDTTNGIAGRPKTLRPIGLKAVAIYKGVWGASEILAGLAFAAAAFVFRHSGSVRAIRSVIESELREDPQDLLIHWLTAFTSGTTYRTTLEFSILVIVFGAAKVALAVGLWRRTPAVRGVAIAFFLAVAAFGAYDLAVVRFSFAKAAVLGGDILILLYLWLILPRHMREAAQSGPVA